MTKKRWILPGVAALMVVAAILVIALMPGKNAGRGSLAERDKNGDIVVREKGLSSDKVAFLRVAEDSGIELLARIGEDGGVKVALGTCQSCNGSPGAYYTQEGSLLKYNNCGLTFPLSVLDSPGGGCHSVMIDPSIIRETQDGVVLDASALSQYEYLFEKVAVH